MHLELKIILHGVRMAFKSAISAMKMGVLEIYMFWQSITTPALTGPTKYPVRNHQHPPSMAETLTHLY